MNFQEITHPDDYDIESNAVKQLLEGKLDKTAFEKRYVKKDGDVIDIYLNTTLPRDAQGLPSYFFTQVQDVTERKQAEEEISSAMSFVDRVIDMSPFAMWITDRKGTVIRTNSALRRTLNMPDDKIIGQYNVLKDENLEMQGVMPKVMAVFENHEPANFSIPWKPATAGDVNFEGARDLHIDVSIFPIVSAKGELTNAVCQWKDMAVEVREVLDGAKQ